MRSRRLSVSLSVALRSPGGVVVDREDPAVVAGLAQAVRDHAGGRDGHAVGDLQMAQDVGAAADRAAAPDAVLPATPVQPAIAVCSPMRTLWPIWIRLSSLTPAPMRVSSRRATVDAGVGADLDIVADDDAAELLDLLPAALVRREAEAVGAQHHAAVQQAARTDAGAGHQRDRRQPGALAHPHAGPTKPSGPITAPSPMTAPDSITACAPTETPSPSTTSGATTALG